MTSRISDLKPKLAFRLYLATIHFQSMAWLSVRRWLLNAMSGRRQGRISIFANVMIEGAEALKVGNSVTFNRDCHISAAGGLTIGDHVSIGHATTILTAEHGFADPDVPIQLQPIEYGAVSIADNVWIGARAIILAGVSLPEGTIVGAGAIVTKPVEEPYCTVAGNPARVIRRRAARPRSRQGGASEPGSSIPADPADAEI